MMTRVRGILLGFCIGSSMLVLAAQQMPQTTKEKIAGQAAVKTEQVKGTVITVEGNTLLVRLSNGELKEFNPPADRRFLVDGKELTVSQLQPGTTLTATVTTTTTPVTERTRTVGTGKVWHVQGNTVILTLPNNENRMYKVADSYRFIVNGEKATVHDLRKGMVVSAEKIVEEPKAEIASNTTVVGHAPPAPKPVVAETTAPAPAAPAAATEPKPAAAPAEAERAAPETPAELPKTGSELPLLGVLGVLSTCAASLVRKFRRS